MTLHSLTLNMLCFIICQIGFPRWTRTNLCLKSANGILLGNPFLQIRIPSSTPLQASWCMTRKASITPGFLSSLGMIQRTKCGQVLNSVVIRRVSCSYNHGIKNTTRYEFTVWMAGCTVNKPKTIRYVH